MVYFYSVFFALLIVGVFYYPFCSLSRLITLSLGGTKSKITAFAQSLIPISNVGKAYNLILGKAGIHYALNVIAYMLIAFRVIVMFISQDENLWFYTAITVWIAIAIIWLDCTYLCLITLKMLGRRTGVLIVLSVLLPMLCCFIISMNFRAWYNMQLRLLEKTQ